MGRNWHPSDIYAREICRSRRGRDLILLHGSDPRGDAMTEITDIEAGLLDGLRTVVEALMAFSYPPDDLAGLLQHQIDAHRDAGQSQSCRALGSYPQRRFRSEATAASTSATTSRPANRDGLTVARSKALLLKLYGVAALYQL